MASPVECAGATPKWPMRFAVASALGRGMAPFLFIFRFRGFTMFVVGTHVAFLLIVA